MSIETIALTIGTDYSILFYVIVALSAFFESIPFFGAFIPGQIIILIGGFLARLNGLSLSAVIIIAGLFAFLGELYAFSIGKKHGFSLVKKYGKYVFINKENFKSIKDLMINHTAKSLILGRFNSLTRALSPFTAGASGLQFKKFAKYSLLGSILWAISFTMIGFIFAEGYKAVAQSISSFILVATFLAIIILAGYRFMNKRKNVFSRTDFYKLIAGILCLYLVANLAEAILSKEAWIFSLDSRLSSFISSIHSDIAIKSFIIITNLFQPIILFSLGIIFAVFLYKKGSRKRAGIVAISLILGSLLGNIIKIFIHRARPEDYLINAFGFSFPSGHATLACIFFLLFIYTLKHNWSKAKKTTLTAISIILILLVGFSRLYLNVHWFSDVIAGYALGIFIVSLSILAIKYIDSEFNEKDIKIKTAKKIR